MSPNVTKYGRYKPLQEESLIRINVPEQDYLIVQNGPMVQKVPDGIILHKDRV